MTSSESAPQPGSGQLLAVACPTCFAAIAVGAELFGRPADCPLCGGGFNVPLKAAPALPEAAAGQQPRADDAPGKRDEHADTTGAATAAPAPATPTDTPADLPAPAAATAAAVSPAPDFAPSTTLAGGHPDPAAAAAAAPGPAAELAFREPVMTVGSGDNVIELRRLTSEEKAQRRARRNIVMLLTGVSILMGIVLSLGRSRR